MTLGQNLIKLRKARHLSQQAMAKEMNVERTTYNRWERGVVYPSLDTIKSLATMFGTTLDELCDFVPDFGNKTEPADNANARLRDMGIKVSSSGNTAIVIVDGLEYAIDIKDLPILVTSADIRYGKLIASISKSMYQSALTMALNSGIVNSSQQYGKNLVNDLEVEVFFWLEKHNEKLVPEVLAEIVKEQLLKLPIRAREDIWQQLVDELVVSNVIDSDQYELDKDLWKCPSYKARRAKK